MDADFLAVLPLGWEILSNFLTLGLCLVVAFLGAFGVASVLVKL